jgi:NAD(P)-dependent dehydrogenase (short-subunit alcohol dehydrogenase family)
VQPPAITKKFIATFYAVKMESSDKQLQGNQIGAGRHSGPLVGRIAVVTGASGGIGRAITIALSREGVRVCALGRNPVALAKTVAAAQNHSEAVGFQGDLTSDELLQVLLQYLEGVGELDILIHCAGVFLQEAMERANVHDFDLQYSVNVRAPYLLTQRLLPFLTRARGQIVFINSTVGLTAKRPCIGQYAATKHALKAIAESLREEVNPKGIRILSAYLGRTATPMQERLLKQEGHEYHPEELLQPEDVASVVVHTLMLPPTAEVTDISIRPMRKLSL